MTVAITREAYQKLVDAFRPKADEIRRKAWGEKVDEKLDEQWAIVQMHIWMIKNNFRDITENYKHIAGPWLATLQDKGPVEMVSDVIELTKILS